MSYETGPSFLELAKELRDIRQNSHWASEIGLPELTHEASATTSFIYTVKELEFAKIPDGRRPFMKMATKALWKHQEQFRRLCKK